MRLLSRAVSAVLALALLAGGVVIAVEIVVAAFGRDPWVLPHDRWYRSTREHSWDDAATRWSCIGLVAAGLLLLILQVLRRRPVSLPLAAGATTADIGRRSLERSLARVATGVDGVAKARVRLSADRADVVAISNRRLVDEVRPRVSDALERRVRSLGLARAPQVKVDVQGRDG